MPFVFPAFSFHLWSHLSSHLISHTLSQAFRLYVICVPVCVCERERVAGKPEGHCCLMSFDLSVHHHRREKASHYYINRFCARSPLKMCFVLFSCVSKSAQMCCFCSAALWDISLFLVLVFLDRCPKSALSQRHWVNIWYQFWQFVWHKLIQK